MHLSVERINEVMSALSYIGFTSVADTDEWDRFCPYDIKAEFNGKIIGFEVKARDKASTDFGDTVIEFEKYEALQRLKNEGKIDRAVLITIFTKDNKVFATDIFSEFKVIDKIANHTTHFKDREDRVKHFCSYDIKGKGTKDITVKFNEAQKSPEIQRFF